MSLTSPLNGGLASDTCNLNEVRRQNVDPKALLEEAIKALDDGFYAKARGLCRVAISQLEDFGFPL